jgi:hypothetical protein
MTSPNRLTTASAASYFAAARLTHLSYLEFV